MFYFNLYLCYITLINRLQVENLFSSSAYNAIVTPFLKKETTVYVD